jgi:hypothetical protein
MVSGKSLAENGLAGSRPLLTFLRRVFAGQPSGCAQGVTGVCPYEDLKSGGSTGGR